MPPDLTHATFAPHVATPFQVDIPGAGMVTLELHTVSDLHVVPGAESFSLLFRGPADPLLPQAIYRFHHAAIGTFDMFIVPIRRDAQGLYYEAVFNSVRREG